MTADRVIRLLVRSVLWLLLAAVLAYPLDWAVWRIRVAFGGGMSTVQVGHLTVAELKGNKEEYYPDDTEVVPCSQSLFPEAGAGACWWISRHSEVIDRP